ncbi:MAG TPA: tetratricopeptide repeat protein, partial [Nannocystaceae bacterium]|nr:tetratricopeptide repeat protein [Nannocystaceae bacterium]
VDGSADTEYSGRVVQAIDRYTDELREQRLAACRSDSDGARGDAAARVACLDRAHAHLEALIGVLEQPGDGRAAAALPAVNELPSPSECSDAAALRRSMPMPDDPVQAGEVAQLRIELSGVRTRFVAGDSQGANAIAQSTLARARALGFEPMIAEALVDAARASLNLADFDRSVEYAEEAYRLAEAHGVDLVTSGALGVLGILRTSSRPDPTLAAWMSRQHEALVHRLGDPPGRLSRVLADRARMHRNLGEIDEAIALLERSDALLDEHGIEDIDRVATLDNLGAAYAATGRHDEAMAAYHRAITIAELVLGPGHNLRVNAVLHLGQEHWHSGNRGRGLTLLHRALDGARRAYSSSHPNLVAVLNTVGVVMLDVDAEAALKFLQEAYDDASAQGNVPDVLRNNLALALRRVGRADEAVALHRALLDGENLGPVERLRWHAAVAEDLLAAGKPADALRELEAGHAVAEAAVPPLVDTPDLFVDLARVQLVLGRDADALDNAKRGVEAHERAKASALSTALARYTLARALRKQAIDPERQLVLVRDAQSAWAANAPEHGRQLAAALAFLLGGAPPL